MSQAAQPVDISWSTPLQVTLMALEERGRKAGVFDHAMDRVARRTLEMVQRGEVVSVDSIVAYIRDYDPPQVGTWKVDEPFFRARAEEVVIALRGNTPERDLLRLKRI